MSHSTPIQSFLGGLSIPIPVHALLLLNGSVFGISGFVHRAMRGSLEDLAGTVGLILGGVFVATLENTSLPPPPLPLSGVLLSGFLVGFGTQVRLPCIIISSLCLMNGTTVIEGMYLWVITNMFFNHTTLFN